MSELLPERVRLGERYEELKQLRSSVQSALEDVQKFVRPNTTDFSRQRVTSATGGGQQNDAKYSYDSTATWANSMFANGLSSYLVPKSERWAYLRMADKHPSDLTEEELKFIEALSNRIRHEFALPTSQFYSTAHEVFQDLGSYGTAAVYIQEVNDRINFKACPLGDTFFDVDPEGSVDTVYYRRFFQARQLAKLFPQVATQESFDPKQLTKMYELVFSIEPNRDVNARKDGKIGSEKPFKTTYWSPDLKEVIDTNYSSSVPFLIPRWMLISGEVYGRSPAMNCMDDIRVLNKMVKELLISAEIANSPPMLAEDDSIMLPVAPQPRSVLYYGQGMAPPQPYVSGSQPALTREMVQDYRDSITRCFFVDQIIRDQKKERQSILEIQDERGQMLQQLAPLLSRMEDEFLGPCIEKVIDILRRKKDPVFDNVPQSIEENGVEIEYTSPAAQAQYASNIGNLSGFLQDMAPILQQKPELMDNIDDNELMLESARMRSIPRKVIKPKKKVEQERQQRAEQDQQAAMMEQAPALAGAMKDVATARKTDPEGTGQLLSI